MLFPFVVRLGRANDGGGGAPSPEMKVLSGVGQVAEESLPRGNIVILHNVELNVSGSC